jgi:cytochrome c peroxidase
MYLLKNRHISEGGLKMNGLHRNPTIVVILTFVIFSLSTAAIANDLTPKEKLGKNLFFDNISSPDWMSCAECHGPDMGWTGPTAGINKHGSVYRGAVPTRFGNRKPPSAAYATLSPVFHYDEIEGLFVGGNFWDGRATGERLGNPAADQALGPFLNPVEQNNPSKQAVCEQVAAADYAGLFEEVWGLGTLDCSPAGVDDMYDNIGLSIAAYEGSSEVNQFSSKYDAYLTGSVDLTEEEQWGHELFHGKAMCAACHPTSEGSPLTDFTYDNLGVPRNPENPFYDMDKELLDDGTPINPLGSDWVDEGLGGVLKTRPEFEHLADENIGKHKVPTLRNVDKRYGDGTPKAYAHNGYFKSLKSIVHFYNTRDVKATCPDLFTTEMDAMRMNCWPEPEVPENVNTDELGNLGLTDEEEDAVVAFMKTLSDGFKVKKNVK